MIPVLRTVGIGGFAVGIVVAIIAGLVSLFGSIAIPIVSVTPLVLFIFYCIGSLIRITLLDEEPWND